MRRTNDFVALFGQKSIRLPVQWMSGVDAKILVGKNLIALAHHKAAKRPVAGANLKFLAARIVEIIDTTDDGLQKFQSFRVGQVLASWIVWS